MKSSPGSVMDGKLNNVPPLVTSPCAHAPTPPPHPAQLAAERGEDISVCVLEKGSEVRPSARGARKPPLLDSRRRKDKVLTQRSDSVSFPAEHRALFSTHLRFLLCLFSYRTRERVKEQQRLLITATSRPVRPPTHRLPRWVRTSSPGASSTRGPSTSSSPPGGARAQYPPLPTLLTHHSGPHPNPPPPCCFGFALCPSHHSPPPFRRFVPCLAEMSSMATRRRRRP